RIKPSAILTYFQNAAVAHADLLGIGYEPMKAKNLCWVLKRLSAVIEKSPVLGEKITVTTLPHKPGIADVMRDYIITNANGECLIRGTSRWCVLDTVSMAVRRCAPMFSYADDQYTPEFTVENGNPQLPEWDGIEAQTGCSFDGRVLLTDLDYNAHMNNVRYADAVINGCDFDFYATHTIRALDFNFLAQMRVGDTYTVRRKDTGAESYFEMVSPKSPRPIFRARLEWNR
ncbi:MAG: hypothetical protein K2M95_01330, partial [Clostridiales bacterium]|nr:hypothetical protein [Clostridiales bacterium]